jgi:long-chain acyl-CoA synthetase
MPLGVPNEDLGEEVKAMVQPMPGIRPDAAFAEELITFCRQHLAHIKCPRSRRLRGGNCHGADRQAL